MTVTTIRFGGYQPPASVHNQAAAVFGQSLTDALGDAVGFDLNGNITLSGHKAADLLTLVEDGSLDLCYFSTSYLAERVPEFGVFDLPFLVEERERAYEAMDGVLGRLLAERVAEQTRFRLINLWDNGFRHLSNRLRPIREPVHCRGMTIRTLFSDLHAQTFRLLGFKPVALDVKELITSIEAGTIDAQENPLTNIFNFGIHNHHRHITLTRHFFGAAALLCNAAAYDAWPIEVQSAVDRAAFASTQEQRRLAAAADEEVLACLSGTDVEIVRLAEAERKLFVQAVAPLVEEKKAAYGPDLFGLLS